MIPFSVERIAEEVRALLVGQLGQQVVAAFVYGSVAAGTAGPRSDLDCFVMITQPVPRSTRTRLAERFIALQGRLGFTADVEYPIELFSVSQCWSALRSAAVGLALDQARDHDRVEPSLNVTDEVEVLRALVDARLPVISSAVLDRLTQAADARIAVAAGDGDRQRIVRGLGVHPAPGCPGRSPTVTRQVD